MPTLQYESTKDEAPPARVRRPAWVYAVVGVYALLVAGVVGLAAAFPLLGANDGEVRLVVGTVTVLVVCGAGLIVVPVRVARGRPLRRGSVWMPVIASGVLAAGLAFGAGLALSEYARADTAWVPVAAAAAVWAVWTAVFSAVAVARGAWVGRVLHRWLLAGSVLELLIAVPAHVVVRRRDECCAGIGTGIGICLGIAVMLTAFGPSVALLYYRRWKQITPPAERQAPVKAMLTSESSTAARSPEATRGRP